MMPTRSLLLAASALLASACTTLGGNVKGAFSCRAPAGSCAPTSTIDAKAVRGAATPAARAAPSPPARAVTAPGLDARREPERIMTIVFPAYVDAEGVLHEEAIAHAVAEPSRWSASSAASVAFSRSSAPSSLREAVAGASALAAEGLESLPPQAPHPIETGAAALPDARALQAAGAGHRIGQPAVPGVESAGAADSGRANAPRREAGDVVRSEPPQSSARSKSEADPGDVFQRAQTPGGDQ